MKYIWQFYKIRYYSYKNIWKFITRIYDIKSEIEDVEITI